jgi:anaerobic magnesium-protoporphyrin IX monomethyl ester cyclase
MGAFSQLGYQCEPMPTKYVSAKEVLRFRDEAFEKYVSNARYLDMIERKFGCGVGSHLRRMIGIPLRRKLLE